MYGWNTKIICFRWISKDFLKTNDAKKIVTCFLAFLTALRFKPLMAMMKTKSFLCVDVRYGNSFPIIRVNLFNRIFTFSRFVRE